MIITALFSKPDTVVPFNFPVIGRQLESLTLAFMPANMYIALKLLGSWVTDSREARVTLAPLWLDHVHSVDPFLYIDGISTLSPHMSNLTSTNTEVIFIDLSLLLPECRDCPLCVQTVRSLITACRSRFRDVNFLR